MDTGAEIKKLNSVCEFAHHLLHLISFPSCLLPACRTPQEAKPSECLQSSNQTIWKGREASDSATSGPVNLLITAILQAFPVFDVHFGLKLRHVWIFFTMLMSYTVNKCQIFAELTSYLIRFYQSNLSRHCSTPCMLGLFFNVSLKSFKMSSQNYGIYLFCTIQISCSFWNSSINLFTEVIHSLATMEAAWWCNVCT